MLRIHCFLASSTSIRYLDLVRRCKKSSFLTQETSKCISDLAEVNPNVKYHSGTNLFVETLHDPFIVDAPNFLFQERFI